MNLLLPMQDSERDVMRSTKRIKLSLRRTSDII